MLDPVMLEVKKLRTLQRKGTEMDKNKVVEKTRKYLVSPPSCHCPSLIEQSPLGLAFKAQKVGSLSRLSHSKKQVEVSDISLANPHLFQLCTL